MMCRKIVCYVFLWENNHLFFWTKMQTYELCLGHVFPHFAAYGIQNFSFRIPVFLMLCCNVFQIWWFVFVPSCPPRPPPASRSVRGHRVSRRHLLHPQPPFRHSALDIPTTPYIANSDFPRRFAPAGHGRDTNGRAARLVLYVVSPIRSTNSCVMCPTCRRPSHESKQLEPYFFHRIFFARGKVDVSSRRLNPMGPGLSGTGTGSVVWGGAPDRPPYPSIPDFRGSTLLTSWWR